MSISSSFHKINNDASFRIYKERNNNNNVIEIPVQIDNKHNMSNLSAKLLSCIFHNDYLQYCLGVKQVDNKTIMFYEPIYDFDLEYAFNNNKINVELHNIVILKILSALHTLHNNGWTHNNVTPDNICLFGQDVRLANFTKTTRKNWSKTNNDMNSKYHPPDTNYDLSNYKNDMWMLGCLIFRIEQGIDLFDQGPDYRDQLAQWFNLTGQTHDIITNNDNMVYPNIISKNGIFIDWSKPWTQIAYNYLLLFDSDKRSSTDDLLKLDFIKDKINQYFINIDKNIYNSSYNRLFPKILSDVQQKENFYEQSLQYWQKSLNVNISPGCMNLLYYIYHISQQLETERKNRILLALYMTQKIVQDEISIPQDKITADILSLEQQLLIINKYRLPLYN